MSDAVLSTDKLTFRQIAKTRTFFVLVSVISVGGVVASTLFMLGAASPEQRDPINNPMDVKTVLARELPFYSVNRIYVGEIKARRSSDLAFERSAKVIEVKVDDGQRVKRNDPLAVLDTKELEIAKEIAEASLENAEARLKELVAGPRQEVIAAARAEMEAFKAERDLAKFIRDQRENLEKSNSISDEEWRRAEQNYLAALHRFDSADKKLKELTEGTREEKLMAQRALVKQLKAQLADVVLKIEKSTLKAPFSGTISARYLDEGEVVAPGARILRITEDQALEAVVGIPPEALSSIRKGMRIDLTNDGHSHATARRVLPETDDRTRMIPVVFEIQGQFSPGQIIRIPIEQTQAKNGVRIPTTALIPGSRGMWSVFVIDGDQNERRAKLYSVTVIANEGDYTLVEETSLDGKYVIQEGTQKVTQGQLVNIVETSEIPQSNSAAHDSQSVNSESLGK